MAIGRISGPLLAKNLIRDGVDLAFETDLLYLDVTTGRIGIRKSNPAYELDVNGTINANNLKVVYTGPGTGQSQLGNLIISTGTISTTVGPIALQPSGNESINLVGNTNVFGNLHATGNITADGNITLGNNTATDVVVFESEIGSNITPSVDNGFSIGSIERNWLNAYVSNLVTNEISSTGTININAGSDLLQINSEIRVTGKNPIGTSPVITNVLHVNLDGNDTNDGRAADPSRACRTITGATRSPYYRPGTLIKVYSGHYLENNPILLQPNTAVVGDDLRTTSIEPINKTQDLFHVQSGCYLAQMQFFNGRSGLLPGPYVNGTNRGAYCTAFPPQVNGAKIDLYQSPYVQNCTNQSGPWLVDGTMFVPNQTVQVPQAVGIAQFSANTTTITVTLTNGSIEPGLNVISGPQDPGFFNARTLMLSNITFIQEQVVAFVNQQVANALPGSPFYQFTYNQAKCYRDVGLIVQNIAYDVTFGGNEKAVEAGLSYWNGVVNYIEGQQVQTTDAINYIGELSQSIIVNQVAPVITTGTAQIINTALIGGGIASDEITNAINIITTIINKGPSSAPTVFNSCGPEAPLVSAELLLQANRNFLQNEVVAYVNSTYPNFVYKQDYCFRDTGLIVDAVSQDIIVGGNTKSIECGLSYFTGGKGDSSVAETAIINNINLIKNIILNGPSVAPPPIVGPNLGGGYSNAQDILKKNLLFVQSEVSAYVRSLFNSNFRLTQKQQNLCYRDIGTILTAIADDVAAGGNINTLNSALSYYSNGLIILPGNQPAETLKSLDYLQYLAVNIVKNKKLTNLYQNYIKQATNPVVGNANQIISIGSNIDRIIDIINNGPTTIINGSPVIPSPIGLIASGDAATQTSATLLHANRYFIQSEIVAYIDNVINNGSGYYQNYSRSKCLRDTGLIVDALVQDLLFGGTSQTDFAGLQYWNQNGYTGQITVELTETINAINYLSYLAQQIVQNITSGTRYTATYHPSGPTAHSQNTSLTSATSAEAAIISSEFTVITNILNNGTAGVTDIIVPNGIVTGTGNITSAVKLLQANKIYIQEQVVGFVEATKPGGFTYDQSKCYRDAGYMVDSVCFDLLYGGNRQAVQSGVYYYAFSSTGAAIADSEKSQTTAAYNYIKTLVSYIVKGSAVPSLYQTAVQQVLPGSVGTSIESEKINANLDLITDIITVGPGIAPPPIPISNQLTYNYNEINAFNLLTSNKDFLAAELTGWIDDTFSVGFNYNANNCHRDTGLIVDSIAFDLLQQDNSQAIFAGLQYWNQAGYTGAIGKELTTTTAAINYAKWLAQKVVVNSTVTNLQTGTTQTFNFASPGSTTASTIIGNLFSTVTNILINGTTGVTNQIVPNTTATTNTATYNAYNLLQANKKFIEEEVIAFVDNNLSQYYYDKTKCSRDTGLIIDAIALDLLYNGTSQSDFAGLQYWNQSGYTGQITVELDQTVSAINFASSLAQQVVQNITAGVRFTPTYYLGGTPTAQTTGTAATSAEAGIIATDFSVITNILINGTAGVTDIIVPNGYSAIGGTVGNAYALLTANKTFIQEQTVAYVETNKPSWFVYNTATCYRDVGYIIDSIRFDLKYGGNKQAVHSGVYYYSFSSSSSAIAPTEKNQITAAYNYIKTLVGYIVTNQTVPAPYQTTVVQSKQGVIATSAEVTALDNNINRITTIINNGPNTTINGSTITPTPINLSFNPTLNSQHAVAQLSANRDFIRAEVIAYLDYFITTQAKPVFVYDQVKCERDVGLIVDALAQDLLFNGTSQSNFSGSQYWAQSGYTGAIGSELTTTTSAINYIRDLAVKVIKNDTTGLRYQSNVSQFTNTSIVVTTTEQQKVYDEFNLIVDIILNGTANVTDRIVPNNLFASSILSVQGAYTLLENNKSYLQAEAVAFVETTKTYGFVYDQTKCRRDIGYMVDSVSFDLLYGGNRQAIQSGVYYYGFSNITAVPNEQVQVTAAYNFIKNISSYIITGQRIPAQYQNNISQVTSYNTGTNVQVTTVTNNINLITSIINGGIGNALTPTPISITPSTNPATLNAAVLLNANRAFIQAETVAYINTMYPAGFNYNRDTCRRDVGYIIDSVSFDLLHGGNRQSVQSGVYYYGYNSNSSVITYELAQVTAAYDRIKQLARGIITNNTVTTTIGNSTPQQFILSANSATSVQISYVENEIDIITDIINNGPNPYYPKKPINLASSSNKGDSDAYKLLLANRQFIQDELIAYINYWFAKPFNYNKATCQRDTGLIIDALAQDLLFGGSSQSDFAAIQYWNQTGYTGLIAVESAQTIEAVTYLKNLAAEVVQNQTTGTTVRYITAASQNTSYTAGTLANATALKTDFDYVINILSNGITGVTDLIVPNSLTASSDTTNAVTVLQANRTYLQQQVVAHVNSLYTGFVYNSTKCSRDTGLIVDALAQDLYFPGTSGNSQIVFSALQYWAQGGNLNIQGTELAATEYAIAQLSTATAAVVTTSLEKSFVQSEFALILNLLNGTTNPATITDAIVPNATTAGIGVVLAAYNAIQSNRDSIISSVANSIKATYPYVWGSIDQAICRRDMGFIIDSISYDLLYNVDPTYVAPSNRQAIQSGIYYLGFSNTTNIPNELPQTTAAYTYLKRVVSYVISAQALPNKYSGASQNISLTAGTSADITAVTNNINLLLNVIKNGPSAAGGIYTPIGLTPNSASANAFALLHANRSFIQAEIIAYINGFTYNATTCARDVGYIVDSVTFDLTYGGNRQAIQSGVYYYTFANSTSVLPTSEVPQTTAAYNYIQTLTNYIVQGIPLPLPYQTKVSQVTSSSVGTSAEISAIDSNINRITTIINNGPTIGGNPVTPTPIGLTPSVTPAVINAANLLESNRAFIQAEVIAYIDTTFPSVFIYDKIKCARDTKLIIDSVALDLVYGGNTQSTFAGLQYWAQGDYTGAIASEITTTTNAIRYAQSLVTATIAGFTSAINSVNSNFDEIVTIINTGTNGITDIIVPNGLPITNTATVTAYTLIQAAKLSIQQQTVNWVTTNNPGFVYNTSTCYRDVGYIIDCVSFDLLNGGNRQSIQAGAYYYVSSYTATNIVNEIPQVVAAYNQLKYLISSVIQSQRLPKTYQKVYDQTIIPAYMGVASAIYGEELITVDALRYLNEISQKVISNTPVPVVRSTATQTFNSAFEGGVHASGPVARNYGIISDIISNGPEAAPVSFVGSGLFATTGVSTDDVRNSPTITSITTQSNNTYIITLSGPTVGDSQNGTLYFGNTLVFPATDAQVEELSLKYTGNTSTWNSRKVDTIGAMGGTLIDGAVISDRSPIQSYVFDAFTQINQGGRGVHITNNGYAQLVSVFTIFCSVGVQTDNGGIASIVNSNANFGDICLLSNGFGKKEFGGTIYNPPYPTYQPNGKYYPFGFYPQNGKVEIYLPDKANRPHIALIMEVEPPETYIDYSGNVVPYKNDQGFPGFLNATPSVAYLTTGSNILSPIDTNSIAVGNAVYVRDQYGNTGTTVNNVFTPYVYPGTVVTDVSYQTVTLNKGLGSGGQDPKNTAQSVNTDYFNVYFCGNAYYTVLSSTLSDNFANTLNDDGTITTKYQLGSNILSAVNTAQHTNQIPYEIDILDNLSFLLVDGGSGLLNSLLVPAPAVAFVNTCIGIMKGIVQAADILAAENYLVPTKKGTPPIGASVAISVLNTPSVIEQLVNDTIYYLTNILLFPATSYNQEKCKRDIKLTLKQITFDLETGGNYYSYYSGLSYWYRSGTHHIVTLEENVTNTALFPDGATVNFYQRSYQSAAGYTFEYVGAGVTYSALPQRGIKDPVQGKEVVQVNNGKVFFTSTDQNGDFRIGPELVISQATGVLSGRTFTKSLFANMTPFILAIEGG
jgi:hypothetical protein